jgi:hypothetical protein
MEETNESRINIKDLPQTEQELSTEEAKDVKGGGGPMKESLDTMKKAWKDASCVSCFS